MNARKRKFAAYLVKSGMKPKEAYDKTSTLGSMYAHAIWVNGALIRKDKAT